MMFLSKVLDFYKNKKGVVAVEFALLALPFFIALIGTMQLALIFLANQTLDEAVDTVGRKLQTGQTQIAGVDVNAVKSDICKKAIFVFDCENSLQLSVRAFATYAEVNAAEQTLYTEAGRPIINDGTFETGSAKDILVISSAVDYPILVGGFFSSNGSAAIKLTSSLAFRAENYRQLSAPNQQASNQSTVN